MVDCSVNWDSGLSAFRFICHLYVSALTKMSCGCVSQYQLREEPTLFVTTSTSLARLHTLHVWMEFVFVSTASCPPTISAAVSFHMTLTRVQLLPIVCTCFNTNAVHSGVDSVCTAVGVIVYSSVCKTHASLSNNQRDPVTLPFLRSVGYVYSLSDFSLRSEQDPFITYNYLMTLTLRQSQVSVKRFLFISVDCIFLGLKIVWL